MNLEELKQKNRQTFSQESEDLLQDLDDALLHLEATPGDMDLVNRVFRAMHTLKGSGATVGFKDLADFLHHVEDAFNAVREGKIPVTSELVDVALKSCDVVRAYLAGKNEQESAENLRPSSAIIAQVNRLLPQSSQDAPAGDSKQALTAHDKERQYPLKIYHIHFKPHFNLFFSGTDPVTLLDELRGLGTTLIQVSDQHLPSWEEFNPEHSYLAWEIQIVTESTESTLRDVFMFVEGECDLQITRVPYEQAEDVPARVYFDAATLKSFTEETEEHMQVIESNLLILENDPVARKPCDPLFRALHNLKGVCRLLISESRIPLSCRHPLQWLGTLGHAFEGIVEKHRDEAGAFQPEVIETLLETVDIFKKLLMAFESGSCRIVPDHGFLEKLGIDPSTVGHGRRDTGKTKLDSSHRIFEQTIAQTREVLDALLLASTEGRDLKGIKLAAGRTLKTFHKAAVKIGASDLAGLIDTAGQQVAGESGPSQDLDKLLNKIWDLAQAKLVVPHDKPEVKIHPNIGEVGNGQNGHSNGNARSIRVDTDKLDRLMRAVGELLVARNAFPLLAGKAELEHGLRNFSKEIKDAGVQISHIADDLQASIMAIRMMPVKNVFQKFPRMVRDMAKSLGKQVDLVLEGEETELDKTVLDQIGDPLVHLVRNAVDHGIEPPEVRADNNKKTVGKVVLRAFNSGSNVIIEIEDDGRGMDAEKLKAKAIEKKLITSDQAVTMSEQQAFELIFHAGFSTAEKITDVSGRGVGMDVVRSNIRALHGTVSIQSRLEHGSKLSMILPTSLLVSKGILLVANRNEYILPMENVVEMIKLPKERIRQLPQGRVAQVREEVLPVLSLGEVLGDTEDKTYIEKNYLSEVGVAVVRAGRGMLGVMVDNFVNQVEVIVKPLSGGLSKLNMYQGATIMGDGRVVLVLNVKAL